MAFLKINGVTIDVADGTWKEEPVDVGELSAKSLAAKPARARATKVRKWTFSTTPLESAADAEKLAKWIEGIGQSWPFDGTLFSGAGVQKTASGTTTVSASGGFIGGKVEVGSGSVFGVKMSNKLDVAAGWLATVHGWTLLARRKFLSGESAAAGWRDLLLKGSVNFTRNSAANPTGVSQYVDGTINASANLGRCLSVGLSDPYVGLHGYKTDNSTSAIDWDDFAFYPFEVPTAWIAGITAFRAANAWPALCRVMVEGDVFASDYGPVECIGVVTGKEIVQLIDDGVVDNARRVLHVTLEEWGSPVVVPAPTEPPLTGMTYWHKADAGILQDASGDDYLADYSGNNRTLREDAATVFSTGATLNGGAGLSIDGAVGAGQLFALDGADTDVQDLVGASGDFTAYFLANIPTPPGAGRDDILHWVASPNGNHTMIVSRTTATPTNHLWVGTPGGVVGQGDFEEGVPALWMVVGNSVSGTLKVFLNEETTERASYTWGGTERSNLAASVGGAFFGKLNANGGSSVWWENLGFDVAHDPAGAERQQVIDYLRGPSRFGSGAF